MVPVAPHHLLDILKSQFLPIIVTDVLPAGDFFKHQHTIFIAAVEKMW